MKKLGRFLEEYLKKFNKSQLQLAASIGVKHSTVGRWINGSAPGLEHCILLASYCGKSPETIIKMTGKPELLETYKRVKLAAHRHNIMERKGSNNFNESDLECVTRLLDILEYGGPVSESIRENVRVFWEHVQQHKRPPQ